MQAGLVENDRQTSGKAQPSQGLILKFWLTMRLGKTLHTIKQLWCKFPDSWYKNPYAWAGIGCTLVFFATFTASWVQWYEYREENRLLRIVADKYRVTSIVLNEPYPKQTVTVGAYENSGNG